MNRTVSQDGAEIRRLREESLRISVTALAARVGINPQSMSNIELGNRRAGLAVLVAIAHELSVPLDQIIKATPKGAAA